MLTNTKGERKKYLMDNFIKIHPKAISKEICEHLIDFFEKQDKLGHTSIGMSGNKTDLETKDSTDLCVKFSFKTGKLFEDIVYRLFCIEGNRCCFRLCNLLKLRTHHLSSSVSLAWPTQNHVPL